MAGHYQLTQIASIVRSLEAPVTSVIHNDTSFLAGDKNGTLTKWNISDGNRSWSKNLDPSISDICIQQKVIMVANGRYLSCLASEDGEVLWSVDFDGACDLVTLNQKTVWVTSSVYEIEIGHFVGCKVHELQIKDGKIVQSIELPSKAWSLEGRGFDCIIGLGRPEPGVYSVLSQNGKLTSVTGTPNLPIVRSVASGNGYISFLTASEVAFEINPDGYLHNTEHNATCVGYRHDGQWLTSARIKEIYGQGRGETEIRIVEARDVVSSDDMTLITTDYNPTEGILDFGNSKINWSHEGEVTSYCGHGNIMSVGFSTGETMLLETGVIENRVESSEFPNHDDSNIRARLRMLRFEE